MSMGTDNKCDIIIEASTRVFPRLGYHKATVEDILREANVARSTFYVYFSSKREIFMNVATAMMSELQDITTTGIRDLMARFAAEGARPSDEDIFASLERFLAEVFRFVENNRGMTRIFFNDFLVIDDETSEMFREFQANLTDEFQNLIRVGEQIGFLRQVNQRRAAEFIVAGLIHMARNISTGNADYDVDQVSREIVDMQINGLRPVPVTVGEGK